jgi:glycosyltransferase involved in cell wall biosynthesis
VKRVLVITPCAPRGLPTQGYAIAQRLCQAGIRTSLLSRAKSSWGRLLDVVFRGFLLLPRHDAVLVNVYGSRAFAYESIAILSAYFWRKRSVVYIRGGWMPEFIERWPRWTRFVLSRANLVLVPHGFLQEALSTMGLRIDGIIPNFIELEKYRFRKRSVLAPRFLYLRGMHSIYNPTMALRAFAIIQRQYPDALLTMAGRESSDSASCRALIQDLNLRNVHFVGLVPKEEIPVLADQHDVHLHTNRVENMPVSVIEMWACGLPIVGTHVGGMPYLVRHRLDGILVESEDYQAMANACLELLSNSALAERLSCNGRRRAQDLTWEHIEPAWERALGFDGWHEQGPRGRCGYSQSSKRYVHHSVKELNSEW